MPRIRSDNDARYALRASFVDGHGNVLQGDTIVIEPPGPGNVFGHYRWSDKETSTDDKKVSINSQADYTLANKLYISRKTQNDFLADNIMDVYITEDSLIYIQKDKDPEAYVILKSTGTTYVAQTDKYREYDVAYEAHGSVPLSKDDDVTVDIINGTGSANDPRITDTDISHWNTAYGWGDHAGLYAPLSHEHDHLNAKAPYSLSSGTLAGSIGAQMRLDFVDNPGNGFPSYGTVLTASGYYGGGGAVQFYAPYGSSWGGTQLRYRLADYTADSANPPWTGWKTIWSDAEFTYTDINNWNTAYGWGDHAGLYAPASHAHGQYTTVNNSAYTGTYPIPVNVSGTLYDTPTAGAVTINGSTGKILSPGEIHGGTLQSDGSVYWGANDQSIRQNNAYNMEMRGGGNGAVGVTLYDNLGAWASQWYANTGGDYGFLGSNWGSWDMKKTVGGDLILNGSQTVYHTGNLPTIPTNNNQLTNGAGYITSSGSITGNAGSVTVNAYNTSGNWYPVTWHSGNTMYSSSGVEIYAAGSYLRAQYLNMTHASTARTADTVFYSSTDDYIRKVDGASFRTSLNVPTRTGGNASGTWGISITGNANYATSAGSASSATNASLASGVSINYNNNSNSTYQMLWGSGTSVYGTAGITCNPASNIIYSSQIVCSDWVRTTGTTGWYNNTYGGGMNMEDSTWVRVYNGKQFYVSNSSANAIATPGDVVAGYSDERLKDVEEVENDALTKIKGWDAIYYRDNEKARELGYSGSERKFGLVAQQVQETLPEVIKRAPADMDADGGSKTGEDYITVDYDRIVPMLVQGIKEQTALIENLTSELECVKLELEELKREHRS